MQLRRRAYNLFLHTTACVSLFLCAHLTQTQTQNLAITASEGIHLPNETMPPKTFPFPIRLCDIFSGGLQSSKVNDNRVFVSAHTPKKKAALKKVDYASLSNYKD